MIMQVCAHVRRYTPVYVRVYECVAMFRPMLKSIGLKYFTYSSHLRFHRITNTCSQILNKIQMLGNS